MWSPKKETNFVSGYDGEKKKKYQPNDSLTKFHMKCLYIRSMGVGT